MVWSPTAPENRRKPKLTYDSTDTDGIGQATMASSADGNLAAEVQGKAQTHDSTAPPSARSLAPERTNSLPIASVLELLDADGRTTEEQNAAFFIKDNSLVARTMTNASGERDGPASEAPPPVDQAEAPAPGETEPFELEQVHLEQPTNGELPDDRQFGSVIEPPIPNVSVEQDEQTPGGSASQDARERGSFSDTRKSSVDTSPAVPPASASSFDDFLAEPPEQEQTGSDRPLTTDTRLVPNDRQRAPEDRPRWWSAAMYRSAPVALAKPTPILAMESPDAPILDSLDAGIKVVLALIATVVILAVRGGDSTARKDSAEPQAPAHELTGGRLDAGRAEAQTGFVSARRLNCRESPVLQARSVRILNRGEPVQVLAREPSWLSIAHRARQCWVAARYISLEPV